MVKGGMSQLDMLIVNTRSPSLAVFPCALHRCHSDEKKALFFPQQSLDAG